LQQKREQRERYGGALFDERNPNPSRRSIASYASTVS